MVEVNLRLDSRVETIFSGEEIFFPPYNKKQLESILEIYRDRAFKEGAFPCDVFEYCVFQVSSFFGDIRKALNLLSKSGETANKEGFYRVIKKCVDRNLDDVGRERLLDRVSSFPLQHYLVLAVISVLADKKESPFCTEEIMELYPSTVSEENQISRHSIRQKIGDLDTMGLVDTRMESLGSNGRKKMVEPSFDPRWIRDSYREYRES